MASLSKILSSTSSFRRPDANFTLLSDRENPLRIPLSEFTGGKLPAMKVVGRTQITHDNVNRDAWFVQEGNESQTPTPLTCCSIMMLDPKDSDFLVELGFRDWIVGAWDRASNKPWIYSLGMMNFSKDALGVKLSGVGSLLHQFLAETCLAMNRRGAGLAGIKAIASGQSHGFHVGKGHYCANIPRIPGLTEQIARRQINSDDLGAMPIELTVENICKNYLLLINQSPILFTTTNPGLEAIRLRPKQSLPV